MKPDKGLTDDSKRFISVVKRLNEREQAGLLMALEGLLIITEKEKAAGQAALRN